MATVVLHRGRPFLACGFLLSDLLNDVVLYLTHTEPLAQPHTHTQAAMHKAC